MPSFRLRQLATGCRNLRLGSLIIKSRILLSALNLWTICPTSGSNELTIRAVELAEVCGTSTFRSVACLAASLALLPRYLSKESEVHSREAYSRNRTGEDQGIGTVGRCLVKANDVEGPLRKKDAKYFSQ